MTRTGREAELASAAEVEPKSADEATPGSRADNEQAGALLGSNRLECGRGGIAFKSGRDLDSLAGKGRGAMQKTASGAPLGVGQRVEVDHAATVSRGRDRWRREVGVDQCEARARAGGDVCGRLDGVVPRDRTVDSAHERAQRRVYRLSACRVPAFGRRRRDQDYAGSGPP